jgi:hypothetical protein
MDEFNEKILSTNEWGKNMPAKPMSVKAQSLATLVKHSKEIFRSTLT